MFLICLLSCVDHEQLEFVDYRLLESVEEPNLGETDLEEVLLGYRIRLSFFGDIFWGRGVENRSKKSPEGFEYPFVKLSSFEKQDHETWIANLECPITKKQERYALMKSLLKFSCRSDFLPFARRYFDVFSLANNHTDNMEEVEGFTQTKDYLESYDFQYFGSYSNSRKKEICEVISVSAEALNGMGKPHESGTVLSFPIALCGYHNVIALPKDDEIAVIEGYAAHFLTIVMPHQGEEYKSKQNRWQERIFRMMIDVGADVVVGGHTHSIQGAEWYKKKPIVYSLGNFIFDQSFGTTMYGLVYRMDVFVSAEEEMLQPGILWDVGKCGSFQDECLSNAEHLSLKKPYFSFQQSVDINHNQKMQPQKASPKISKQKKKEMGWFSFVEESPQEFLR